MLYAMEESLRDIENELTGKWLKNSQRKSAYSEATSSVESSFLVCLELLALLTGEGGWDPKPSTHPPLPCCNWSAHSKLPLAFPMLAVTLESVMLSYTQM